MSRWVSRSRSSGCILLAVAAVALAAPAAAFACDPGRPPHYQDQGLGRTRDSNNYWQYISSDITVRAPFVHNDNVASKYDNFSYAFDMLDTHDGTAWAQIGPSVENDGSRDNFAECRFSSGSTFDYVYSASALDSTPTYKVAYGSGGNKSWYINGTLKDSCTATFSPVNGQTSVETQDDDDQVPGHISGHEVFNNTTVQSSTGGVHDFYEAGALGFIGSPGGWFNNSVINNTRFDAWDGGCP